MSNLPDYQAVLEQVFMGNLLEQGTSKKTQVNYRTDLRNFTNWAVDAIKLTSYGQENLRHNFFTHNTSEVIENYKRSQILAHTPRATVNRRLSAVRMFFKCAVSQGWTQEDPTEYVLNIPKPREAVTVAPADHQLPEVHLLQPG